MRKVLVISVIAVIGAGLIFLGGYLPGSAKARRAEDEARQAAERQRRCQDEMAKTQLDLDVARLRGRLGEVLHEANANNFGLAAAGATAFFDGVATAMNSGRVPAGSQRRKTLEAVLSRRDEISADLARADQGVKAKLAQMYMQFGGAVE